MDLEREPQVGWKAPKPRLYTITWVQNCQEFKKEHCSDKEVKEFIDKCAIPNAYLTGGGTITNVTIASEDWEVI